MLEQCDQENTSSEQISSYNQLDITALIKFRVLLPGAAAQRFTFFGRGPGSE